MCVCVCACGSSSFSTNRHAVRHYYYARNVKTFLSCCVCSSGWRGGTGRGRVVEEVSIVSCFHSTTSTFIHFPKHNNNTRQTSLCFFSSLCYFFFPFMACLFGRSAVRLSARWIVYHLETNGNETKIRQTTTTTTTATTRKRVLSSGQRCTHLQTAHCESQRR